MEEIKVSFDSSLRETYKFASMLMIFPGWNHARTHVVRSLVQSGHRHDLCYGKSQGILASVEVSLVH